MVMVSRKFKPPFYRRFCLYIAILPFLSLFGDRTFGNIFVRIAPLKYKISTKINPRSKVIFSCLKDFKTTLHDFFYFSYVIQSNNQKAVKRKINILNESLA